MINSKLASALDNKTYIKQLIIRSYCFFSFMVKDIHTPLWRIFSKVICYSLSQGSSSFVCCLFPDHFRNLGQTFLPFGAHDKTPFSEPQRLITAQRKTQERSTKSVTLIELFLYFFIRVERWGIRTPERHNTAKGARCGKKPLSDF